MKTSFGNDESVLKCFSPNMFLVEFSKLYNVFAHFVTDCRCR